MPWSIERSGVAASRITLLPVSGDVTVEVEQSTGVFEALDGNRVVWVSPRRPANVTVPDLWVESKADVDRLVNLATSGARLILTDETGATFAVRAVDGVKYRLLDTPGQATAPKFLVTLKLVGVR